MTANDNSERAISSAAADAMRETEAEVTAAVTWDSLSEAEREALKDLINGFWIGMDLLTILKAKKLGYYRQIDKHLSHFEVTDLGRAVLAQGKPQPGDRFTVAVGGGVLETPYACVFHTDGTQSYLPVIKRDYVYVLQEINLLDTDKAIGIKVRVKGDSELETELATLCRKLATVEAENARLQSEVRELQKETAKRFVALLRIRNYDATEGIGVGDPDEQEQAKAFVYVQQIATEALAAVAKGE